VVLLFKASLHTTGDSVSQDSESLLEVEGGEMVRGFFYSTCQAVIRSW
jgi:hypothetical protein